MRKGLLGAVAALTLLCAPAAMAAGSPTVTAGAATAIADTAATLHGTVNPNGAATTYQFAWGTTTALGNLSPAAPTSAGAGAKTVAEHTRIRGLTPATTYYYELVATNASGASNTPIGTFKTSGNPPPSVTTGAAVSVQRDRATFTGTIAPNNQATTYYFRFGLSTSYGFQTATQTVPAGTTPVPVSFVAIGLTPGYTFHYQLVASHGTAATTVIGADSVFETQPYPRPTTSFTSYLSPKTVKQAPYSFTVHGTLSVPTSTPAALYCVGDVRVRIYAGSKRLSSKTVPVQPNCGYSASTKLSSVPRGSGGKSSSRVQLHAYVLYEGGPYSGLSKLHALTAYAG